MSQEFQPPLLETELSFINFGQELDFWRDAANAIYDELDGDDEAVDATNPVTLAEMIQKKYPVSLPTRQGQQYAVFEMLADVHAKRVGVHGYGGLWIKTEREVV